MTDTANPDLPAGYILHRFETVGSTMDEARALTASGPEGPQVVWAEEQNAGRGRRGRHWVSPPGNLYVTVALPLEVDVGRAAEASLVVALAISDAILQCCPDLGSKVRLKWPNDVLIDNAKTVGLLLELTGDRRWLLIGSGVNIETAPDGMPYPVARLADYAPGVAPVSVLEAYLAALETWRRRWRAEGFDPVRRAWLSRAAGLNEDIVVSLPTGTKRGRFEGLDDSGALLLSVDGGAMLRIDAGDVVLTQEGT